jgi:predicted DNA binding protein
MIQVTLRLKISDSWFSGIVDKFSTPVKIIECKDHGHNCGCNNYVEVIGIEDNLDLIKDELMNHPHVEKVDLSPLKKGIAFGIVKTNQCGICTGLHETDCFLTSYSSKQSGEIEWKLVGPNEESVAKVIDDLKKTGTDIKLVSKIHLDPSALLTARQELIMEVAFKRGYFEYPKRIKMEELARIFDVSRSTISEIMRKGQQRIIGNYFDDASM